MKLRALKIDFFLRFTALWRTMNDWNNWKKSWNCSTYLCNVDLDPRVCFFRFFEHLKAAAIAATLKIVQMYFNYMVDDLDLHQKSLFLRWCTSFKRSLWKNIMKPSIWFSEAITAELLLLSKISIDFVKILDLVKFYLLTKKTKNFTKSRFYST